MHFRTKTHNNKQHAFTYIIILRCGMFRRKLKKKNVHTIGVKSTSVFRRPENNYMNMFNFLVERIHVRLA